MTRESDRDIQEAAALDQYWDRLVAGEASLPPAVDRADADTIRAFHAQVPRHQPGPHFVARLEAQLMEGASAGTVGSGLPSPGFGANGRVSPRLIPGTHVPRSTQTRWLVSYTGTAALLLLILIGSVWVFGPGRMGRQGDSPAFLPAVMPAVIGTPGTLEALTGPAAVFVWEADGGPQFPFDELGQPAIDGEGTLWVADGDNSRFLLYAPDGTFREAWGMPGRGEGEFNFQTPGGIGFGAVAFDNDGNIYVADTGNARIQKFGPDRQFITAWGSRGADEGQLISEGQLMSPVAILVDDQGHVYVSDNGWGKIEVFDDTGMWLATWSGLSTPVGLTIDSAGNIWLADYASKILQFSPDGEILGTWDTYGRGDGELQETMGIAVDAEGRVFVSDRGQRVQIFAPDGTFLAAWGERGTEPGQFNGPIGLVLDGQGAIYVTEDYGQRVQKFRLLPPFGP